MINRPMFVMMAYELVCMHCLGKFCGELHHVMDPVPLCPQCLQQNAADLEAAWGDLLATPSVHKQL